METGSAGGNGDSEFRRRLSIEVSGWEREGLISVEQAGAILRRYEPPTAGALSGETYPGVGDPTVLPVDPVERNTLVGRAVSVIGVMGALLVGLGIIIYVTANWDVIPVWARVTMLVALTAAINAVRLVPAGPVGLPARWRGHARGRSAGIRGVDPPDRPDPPRSRKPSQSDHRVVPERTADGICRAFPPVGGSLFGPPRCLAIGLEAFGAMTLSSIWVDVGQLTWVVLSAEYWITAGVGFATAAAATGVLC